MKTRILAMAMAALTAGTSAHAQTEPRSAVPLHSLITSDDYPMDSLTNHEEGEVHFRLDIDEKGVVAGCTILRSSGSASLDATSCRIMTSRARFVPASDESGKPVPSDIRQSIHWRMARGPGDELPGVARLRLWTECLTGEAAKHSVTAIPPEEVPAIAFRACEAIEPHVLAAIREGDLPGHATDGTMAVLKNAMTAAIMVHVVSAREGLAVASDENAGSDGED